MEYSITDDVTLTDAINYAEEIYASEIIEHYIDDHEPDVSMAVSK